MGNHQTTDGIDTSEQDTEQVNNNATLHSAPPVPVIELEWPLLEKVASLNDLVAVDTQLLAISFGKRSFIIVDENLEQVALCRRTDEYGYHGYSVYNRMLLFPGVFFHQLLCYHEEKSELSIWDVYDASQVTTAKIPQNLISMHVASPTVLATVHKTQIKFWNLHPWTLITTIANSSGICVPLHHGHVATAIGDRLLIYNMEGEVVDSVTVNMPVQLVVRIREEEILCSDCKTGFVVYNFGLLTSTTFVVPQVKQIPRNTIALLNELLHFHNKESEINEIVMLCTTLAGHMVERLSDHLFLIVRGNTVSILDCRSAFHPGATHFQFGKSFQTKGGEPIRFATRLSGTVFVFVMDNHLAAAQAANNMNYLDTVYEQDVQIWNVIQGHMLHSQRMQETNLVNVICSLLPFQLFNKTFRKSNSAKGTRSTLLQEQGRGQYTDTQFSFAA